MIFQEYLKYLKDLRQSIKKKRFILDETQEKFGLIELKQLTEVKNDKEIKGYPFYGKNKNNNEIGIKIVPIEKKYNKYNHPSMLECTFLKEMTDEIINKNISPHIVYYLGYNKIPNNAKAIRFLNLKKLEIEDVIRSNSNLLISEFVKGGSLDNWVYTTYENKQEISDTQWKILVFQLLYTICVFQKHYKLMHNDCHYGNILIDNTITPGGYFVYKINGSKYYIPNTGIMPKIWDFEFSMSYNNKMEGNYINAYINNGDNETDNTEEYNVPDSYNEVYDVHYLLTSLLDLYIPQKMFDWILSLYPDELIPEDKEKTTTEHSTSENENTISMTDLTLNTSNNTDSTEQTTTGIREHILDGRLINGTEKIFRLPTPLKLLKKTFFDEFLIKPQDFDINNSYFFDSRIA